MKKSDLKVDAVIMLVVTFPIRAISVSYFSNLLRILQATLREAAKAQPDRLERLYMVPRPVLYHTVLSQDESMVLNMYFREGDPSHEMGQFNAEVTSAFVTALKDFLLGNAQTHLWEYAVPESRSSHDSLLESRLASLVKEMKKYPGSSISIGNEEIRFSLNGFEVN